MANRYLKSASIILERTDGRILLVKRNPDLHFFGNFWAFPGGKIDEELPEDWIGDEEEVLDTLFREMYEEIGIIPGGKTIRPQQRKLEWDMHDYDDLLFEEFKSSLRFIGRKRTPPFRRRVYDAAYFAIKHKIVDQIEPEIDGSELVELKWMHPSDIIELWKKQELLIPPPNLHIIRTMANDYKNLEIKTLVETELTFGLQTRIEFADGYEVIPVDSDTIEPFDNTNLVVISSQKNNGYDRMIVDPGASEKGKNHLETILATLDGINKVYITHHHLDHWRGMDKVLEMFPNITIYAGSKSIERMIANGINLPSTNLIDIDKKNIHQISIGNKQVKVLRTPGHCHDHTCLYDEKMKILIAGDHVVGHGSAVLDPKTGSMKQYLETTLELMKLELKIIIPSHGAPNFKPKKLLEQYYRHRINREKAILGSIKSGKNRIMDIVKEVYKDVPPSLWEFAKYNIRLHIDKLVEDGMVMEADVDLTD